MAQPKNQNLIIERWDYRLTFAKEGRARYISHLDLMRTMQRAIKRARVPIWYTQGFNPHAYLMFPLALPLGTDSEIETLDIALTEDWDFDNLVGQLNGSMPEGLYFISAARPVRSHKDIASARYEIEMTFDKPADEIKALFDSFISGETIEIEKRVKPKKGRKPGVKLVDIKPLMTLNDCRLSEDKLFVDITLPAGVESNINTGVVIDAFCSFAKAEIDSIYTKRTKILCKDGEDFT